MRSAVGLNGPSGTGGYAQVAEPGPTGIEESQNPQCRRHTSFTIRSHLTATILTAAIGSALLALPPGYTGTDLGDGKLPKPSTIPTRY